MGLSIERRNDDGIATEVAIPGRILHWEFQPAQPRAWSTTLDPELTSISMRYARPGPPPDPSIEVSFHEGPSAPTEAHQTLYADHVPERVPGAWIVSSEPIEAEVVPPEPSWMTETKRLIDEALVHIALLVIGLILMFLFLAAGSWLARNTCLPECAPKIGG